MLRNLNVSGSLSQSAQILKLSTWLELSITCGPLIPTLQLVILLGLLINTVTFQIGVHVFHATPDDHEEDRLEESIQSALIWNASLGYAFLIGLCFNMRIWSNLLLLS